MHDIYRYSHNGKLNSVFLLNWRQYSRKQSQNACLSQFLDKSDEKVADEKTYQLKLEFDNAGRKMKSAIRHIFT